MEFAFVMVILMYVVGNRAAGILNDCSMNSSKFITFIQKIHLGVTEAGCVASISYGNKTKKFVSVFEVLLFMCITLC